MEKFRKGFLYSRYDCRDIDISCLGVIAFGESKRGFVLLRIENLYTNTYFPLYLRPWGIEENVQLLRDFPSTHIDPDKELVDALLRYESIYIALDYIFSKLDPDDLEDAFVAVDKVLRKNPSLYARYVCYLDSNRGMYPRLGDNQDFAEQSVREERKVGMRMKKELILDSVKKGAKVGLADEAGTMVLEFVNSTTGGKLQPYMQSPEGKALVKLVAATMLMHGIDLVSDDKDIQHKFAAGCGLVIEAASRDVLQPRISDLRKIGMHLAGIGERSLTSSSS